MADNAPETNPSGSSPTSARALFVEGLALTVLIVSFLMRVFTAATKLRKPSVSHYLPPDVTTRPGVGVCVTRGEPAFVTIRPGQTLKASMSMQGHIAYRYEDETGFHIVVVAEPFTLRGTDFDPHKVYTIPTGQPGTVWQTLVVTVYTEFFDNNIPQQSNIKTDIVCLQ